MERVEYSEEAAVAKVESLPVSEPSPALRKKKKNKNKRRFSDEQIRLLESMFESETKPEPVKKAQLARELGLQPRQVAIWFQNKRARWKAKQIEQEYRALSANYDALKSRFESLKKEKQSLLMQLQSLSDLLERPNDGNRAREALGINLTNGGSDNDHTHSESGVKQGFLQEGLENRVSMCLHDDKSRSIGHLESDDLPITDEHIDGFSTSPEEWCIFDQSGGPFDQPCSSSQWWDFIWT